MDTVISQSGDRPTRKVGLLLGVGIFLLPIIFAWFTLRAGHSTKSRVISFGWLIVSFLVAFGQQMTDHSGPRVSRSSSGSEPAYVAEAKDPETDTSVTAAKYEQLRTGMSYEQAVKIMGSPGEELSTSDIAGYRTTMVAWKNWNGSNMNAMFQNGKLIQKAQFGLK